MIIRCSSDKPGRCPKCWRYPDYWYNVDHTRRCPNFRLRWRLQHCDYCNVTWWRGYSNDLWFTWVGHYYFHWKRKK